MIKMLLVGLGVFSIVLSGGLHPGLAQASLVSASKLNSTYMEKGGSFLGHPVQSHEKINQEDSRVFFARSRNSTYRKEHTINNRSYKRPAHRNSFRANRPSHSGSVIRKYSKKRRLSSGRSSLGKGNNSFRHSNRSIFKRPKSRRFEFITPSQ